MVARTGRTMRLYTHSSPHVWSYAVNIAEEYTRDMLGFISNCDIPRLAVEHGITKDWTMTIVVCWKLACKCWLSTADFLRGLKPDLQQAAQAEQGSSSFFAPCLFSQAW
jgi:hypothetical protein